MIYINTIVALQTFLFGVLLYKKSVRNLLNQLLGLLLFLLGATLLGNILILSTNMVFFNSFFFLTQAFTFLIAPIVCYYLNLLSGRKVRFTSPLFFLTVLLASYFVYVFVDYLLLESKEQSMYFENFRKGEFSENIILYNWFCIVLEQAYFSFLWIRISRLRKVVGNVFSNRTRTRNTFAYKFITFVWILDFCVIIAMLLLDVYNVQFMVLPYKTMIAFSFVMYFVFEQNAIFNEESYLNYLKDVKILNKAIEQGEENKECEEELLNATMIKNTLLEHKMYLNPSVTIFDLSEKLASSHRSVSSVINRELNQNFVSLINELRVEEAKRILIDNVKNLTMEGIGLESGFNSRASFYRVFKARTNVTPTEYIKRTKMN